MYQPVELLSVDQRVTVAKHLQASADLRRAELICRHVLELEPDNQSALTLLEEIVFAGIGSPASISSTGLDAAGSSRAVYYKALGKTYEELTYWIDAARSYLQVLRWQPNCVEIFDSLKMVLAAMKLPECSMIAGRVAQRIAICAVNDSRTGASDDIVNVGDLLKLYMQLGAFFDETGSPLDARSCFDSAVVFARRAVELFPETPETQYALGEVLLILDRTVEAIAALRRAVELGVGSKHLSHFWNTLSLALGANGQLVDAMEASRAGLALAPGNVYAHLTLSFMLLADGDFESGWPEFEWRLIGMDKPGPAGEALRWHGESLIDHSIIICSEGGFGDTLMFVRFVNQIAKLTSKITLECPGPLVELLRANTAATVIERGKVATKHDYYIQIMSIPSVLHTRIESIPQIKHYIHANDVRSAELRELSQAGKGLRVGLVWASGGKKGDAVPARFQRDKSINFGLFQQLLIVPNITFYNLQKDESTSEAQSAIASGLLLDYTGKLTDFADNAAFVANLDLIITVDSAIAHLAGAMGRPVWLLLHFSADWRWLRNRDDSPWYASIRLFRQRRQHDWPEVLARVTEEIMALASQTH